MEKLKKLVKFFCFITCELTIYRIMNLSIIAKMNILPSLLYNSKSCYCSDVNGSFKFYFSSKKRNYNKEFSDLHIERSNIERNKVHLNGLDDEKRMGTETSRVETSTNCLRNNECIIKEKEAININEKEHVGFGIGNSHENNKIKSKKTKKSSLDATKNCSRNSDEEGEAIIENLERVYFTKKRICQNGKNKK